MPAFVDYVSEELQDKSSTIGALKQGSKAWFEQRHGRVTASIAKNVVKFTKYHTADNYLTKTVLGNYVQIDTKPMKHGRYWEPVGRKLLVEQLQETHDNVQCKDVGLIVAHDTPYVAASPDGIVSCDCHGDSVLEVKTTWKHWSAAWDDIKKDKKYHFTEEGKLKADSSWMWQIQCQMGACELKTAHFVFVHGNGKEIYHEIIEFNQEQWDTICSKSAEFFKKCTLPFL